MSTIQIFTTILVSWYSIGFLISILSMPLSNSWKSQSTEDRISRVLTGTILGPITIYYLIKALIKSRINDKK